ncbi:TolB-like translocation protein [Gynurincola endophyticus]|uniref:PD40 domain-containing protein n=1 Tax=Gynurincola endophyticus TaxID=2479004 RepID=UPI000F8C6CCC|nr:PD40 domain-containing protein [Gynurincola endophyticus]
MKQLKIFQYCVFFLLLTTSCSKNDNENGNNHYPSSLRGTIYYKWATQGILKMSFPGGEGGAFMDDSKLNNFDVSRDGKFKLTAHNASTIGNYPVQFTLSNLSDNAIVEQFNYTSPAGNSYCDGFLSPDNTMILVQSNDTEEDGITILKTNGDFVVRLDGIDGVPFSMHDVQFWLPGNALLLTHGNNIIRVDPPYTSGTLVRTMQYADWSDLTVNHQGTQLAVKIGNHIHTMDMNGENVTQITTSNFVEARPVFSPDGNYLLVGTHYRVTGPMGHSWDLKIIPNDGKQYNVDPNQENSPGVLPVIWNNKDRIETASGHIIWK